MFQISSEEVYRDGEMIFREGNAGDWIYEVLSGEVEITKQVGDRQVVIEKVGQGGIFGELSFISKTPRNASVRAVGQTTVGVIDRTFLDQEYNKLSGAFCVILKTLSDRLRMTTEMALDAQILRRQNPRVKKMLTLSIRSQAGLAKAFSEDVSLGGMFIRTSSPLALDEVFNLKIQLPGEENPLDVGCQVCWVRSEAQAREQGRPSGMGVKFIQMSESDKQRLKQELQATMSSDGVA
jgi:uncharacterized protein (TIGR02266 family)